MEKSSRVYIELQPDKQVNVLELKMWDTYRIGEVSKWAKDHR